MGGRHFNAGHRISNRVIQNRKQLQHQTTATPNVSSAKSNLLIGDNPSFCVTTH